jgi:hypothetical protein
MGQATAWFKYFWSPPGSPSCNPTFEHDTIAGCSSGFQKWERDNPFHSPVQAVTFYGLLMAERRTQWILKEKCGCSGPAPRHKVEKLGLKRRMITRYLPEHILVQLKKPQTLELTLLKQWANVCMIQGFNPPVN